MEQISLKIGERLKEIRNTRQLTLDDVAELTGVSKPMLGQIERGQSSPTINVLWKISTGLKIPLSFFCRQQEAEYTVAGLDKEDVITEEKQMNNNLSRFADSKVYFQCPICTKSMDIQGNSLICRHGHCFDISRYGYVNLLLKSSPKTNYSKRSFDNRHQILEYGMYDVVLEKIIQFILIRHL